MKSWLKWQKDHSERLAESILNEVKNPNGHEVPSWGETYYNAKVNGASAQDAYHRANVSKSHYDDYHGEDEPSFDVQLKDNTCNVCGWPFKKGEIATFTVAEPPKVKKLSYNTGKNANKYKFKNAILLKAERPDGGTKLGYGLCNFVYNIYSNSPIMSKDIPIKEGDTISGKQFCYFGTEGGSWFVFLGGVKKDDSLTESKITETRKAPSKSEQAEDIEEFVKRQIEEDIVNIYAYNRDVEGFAYELAHAMENVDGLKNPEMFKADYGYEPNWDLFTEIVTDVIEETVGDWTYEEDFEDLNELFCQEFDESLISIGKKLTESTKLIGYFTLQKDIPMCHLGSDEFADCLEFAAEDLGVSFTMMKIKLRDAHCFKDGWFVLPAGMKVKVEDIGNTYVIYPKELEPASFDVVSYKEYV